jgi:hypothetical protein
MGTMKYLGGITVIATGGNTVVTGSSVSVNDVGWLEIQQFPQRLRATLVKRLLGH